VAGKNVLLVDDEVVTAGSVAGAVNILKEHGAGDIYLSFAHAVFAPGAIELLCSLPIHEIVCTDTVPIPPAPRKCLSNMTVLSVAPLLGEVIRRVHEGKSVGEMFGE
jgi:ribose-phosphate pyrophosphokinase